MSNQIKFKVAAATLGIAVLVAAVAVPTVLALRDDEVVTPEATPDPYAQQLFGAGELNVDAEAQGMIEPLFIHGEPVVACNGEVKVLPDGSVSISNPDVEPMPIQGQPPEDVIQTDGIVIGEPFPPQLAPAVEGTAGTESGASSGSVGPAVGPVVVNASDLPPAPEPEPGVVREVPIGTLVDDVQIN